MELNLALFSLAPFGSTNTYTMNAGTCLETKYDNWPDRAASQGHWQRSLQGHMMGMGRSRGLTKVPSSSHQQPHLHPLAPPGRIPGQGAGRHPPPVLLLVSPWFLAAAGATVSHPLHCLPPLSCKACAGQPVPGIISTKGAQ